MECHKLILVITEIDHTEIALVKLIKKICIPLFCYPSAVSISGRNAKNRQDHVTV